MNIYLFIDSLLYVTLYATIIPIYTDTNYNRSDFAWNRNKYDRFAYVTHLSGNFVCQEYCQTLSKWIFLAKLRKYIQNKGKQKEISIYWKLASSKVITPLPPHVYPGGVHHWSAAYWTYMRVGKYSHKFEKV